MDEKSDILELSHLERHAERLYDQYSTRSAYVKAREGLREEHPISKSIPCGKSWTRVSPEASSISTGGKPVKQATLGPFEGDMSLARSIMFMHDMMLSREYAQSIAEGDPHRVYEAIKRMCVSFAGSSHSKYTTYTLEMICNLELESSPELKAAYLRNMLVNPSGEMWMEGDLHLEHLNLELENNITHKNGEWDDEHIRTVVAPNISHFTTLKNTFREGIGLAKRRSKHTAPHSRPEIKILLRTYRDEQLHFFRKGRCYGDSNCDVDTFAKGYKALYEGKMSKFIGDSTARLGKGQKLGTETLEEYLARVIDDNEEDDDNVGILASVGGSICMDDGELIVDLLTAGNDSDDDELSEDDNDM